MHYSTTRYFWCSVMEVLVLLAVLGLALGADLPYQVGVGRADVTGPSVQIEMVRLNEF